MVVCLAKAGQVLHVDGEPFRRAGDMPLDMFNYAAGTWSDILVYSGDDRDCAAPGGSHDVKDTISDLDVIGEDLAEWLTMNDGDEKLEEIFWAAVSDTNSYPVFEDAVSCSWPNLGTIVAAMVPDILDAILSDYGFSPVVIDGQTTMEA